MNVPILEVRLREILSDVLDLDPEQISDDFSRDDESGWDSMAHLRLITAVEQAFGLKFTMREIEEIRSYGDLRERVAANQSPS
ncbi:MAG TPA: acyl carrier protein [Thermoanaerobaculia bacterium]|nr:acyl carrier protein [Thermoanaerobaculia bacterium]